MDNDSCHFCGRARSDVRFLIDGPRVLICADSVDACTALLPTDGDRGVVVTYRPASLVGSAQRDGLESMIASVGPHCRFCGKRDREVAAVVEGPLVRICDECLALCRHILERQGIPAAAPGAPRTDGH
jgi:hypothetical protein